MTDLPEGFGQGIPDCPRCRDRKKVADDYAELNQRLIDTNNQLKFAVREMKKKVELIRKWLAELDLLAGRF